MNSKGLNLWIAPRLDRKTHQYLKGDWRAKDYPGHKRVNNEWSEKDWNTAINIFEDRIYGRFLNYVAKILEYENAIDNQRAGFVVLALDCLLIETLQQFAEGQDTSRSPERAFRTFLTSSICFNQGKGSFQGDANLANLFYHQIRCGILHQAEIKADSLVSVSGELVKVIGDGIDVNRVQFHEQLVEEFRAYVKKLRKPKTDVDRQLREKFTQKMNYICRVNPPPDLAYYFAYHPNTTKDLLIQSIPAAKCVGKAKLPGKRLIFSKINREDKSGRTNLTDDDLHVTWGVIYELPKANLVNLDKYEAGYQRTKNLPVLLDNNDCERAITYVSNNIKDELHPLEEYKRSLIQWANDHELPKAYIQFIEASAFLDKPGE